MNLAGFLVEKNFRGGRQYAIVFQGIGYCFCGSFVCFSETFRRASTFFLGEGSPLGESASNLEY